MNTYSAVAAGTILFAAGPASAQDNDQQVTEEVTVSGTRISGFTTPTPVTTLDIEVLEDKAVRNLSDVILELPTLRPVKNVGQTSQPVGAANLDLHSLGPNR